MFPNNLRCTLAGNKCGAWKWSEKKGNQCRLLPSAPTAHKIDNTYISGMPGAAPSPSPVPPTPKNVCDVRVYGAKGDGKFWIGGFCFI